jgi:branched-chain amino acid transport system ATP-binding protein
MALLDVRGLSKHFGGLLAINELDFGVEEGTILGVIGPNGAGKTTLYNLITGVFKPTKGRIIFRGEDITGLRTHRIASRGLVRTFQATTLFPEMTSLNNVLLAHHLSRRAGDLAQFTATPGFRKEDDRVRKRSIELLEYMGLGPVRDVLAKNLPHGHQRALGIVLAMAASPKLLLLDEPATGMDDTETEILMDQIRRIRDEMKITLLVVEHDMKVIMGLSERIVVLNFGRKIAEGPPGEVSKNSEVIEAYLGREEDE